MGRAIWFLVCLVAVLVGFSLPSIAGTVVGLFGLLGMFVETVFGGKPQVDVIDHIIRTGEFPYSDD